MRRIIAARLISGFIVVVLMMILMAVYLLSLSQKTSQQFVGKNSIFFAEEMLKRVNHDIYLKIEELQIYSKDLLLKKAIMESNEIFQKIDNIEEYINKKDREWISMPTNEITSFMQELMSNELSNSLRKEFIEFYEKKYGYRVFGEIIVTNKYGANVAQTGKIIDYRQDDEEWWQIARAKGSYLSDVEYDESSDLYAISIGIRVDDLRGNFAGVVKAVLSIKAVIRKAEIATRKYKTTEIKLITKDGRLIYATKAFRLFQNVSDREFFKRIEGESGFFIATEGGIERLYSYTRSKGLREFEVLGWILVVAHDVEEVLKPAFMLRKSMMYSSFFLILLSVIIASVFYVSISKAENRVIRQSAVLDAVNKVFKETLTCDTDREVVRTSLAVVEELTRSEFGFVGEVNQKGHFDIIAWNDSKLDESEILSSDVMAKFRDIKIEGIWGKVLENERSLIVNNPASHTDCDGFPISDLPLTSFLGVPLKRGDQTMGMIALTNKRSGYDSRDQQDVERLSVALVEALMRKRTEEELRKHRHRLEELVEERTTELKISNEHLQLEITERKRIEKALRQSEQKYRKLVESTVDWVWTCDLHAQYTFSNDAVEQLLGYEVQEVVGMSSFELMHPDDRKKVQKWLQVAIEEKRGWKNSTIRWLHKDGSIRFFESSAQPILDSDSYLIGFTGIDRDITSRIRGEKEKQELQDQLLRAQKMESVGTLAGGVAHDFNNLLQAILGYGELLLFDIRSGEPGRRELQEIIRAAKRGSELTRQLLTFSRKVESRLQPVDLNHEIDHVRRLLERTIPKMIAIELRLMGNLRRVNADPAQIEQILMNLALNAKDAMPDSGKLIIETRNIDLDEEYCRYYPEMKTGEYVLLTVSDTGHGMDEKTLEHIFDPFYTTKEVGKGTGLGLAIIYGIVKNHNGHITCISEPCKGSAFNIYLPAIEPVDEPSLAAITEEPRGGSETILLVDDEDFIRNLGREILTRFGYTVLSAVDGESALGIYIKEKDNIDLVILDLIMPGMGGRQCLHELLGIDPNVKVVIASGYSADGPDAFETRARSHINKPYEVRQMLKVIREVLDENEQGFPGGLRSLHC